MQLFRHLFKGHSSRSHSNPLRDSTHSDNEIEMAKKVQQGLLSVNGLKDDSIQIAMRCVPANDLGGDFYCVNEHIQPINRSKTNLPGIITYQHDANHFISLFIGDVAGHGLSSALVMSLCSGIFPKIIEDISSPSHCLNHLNALIHPYLDQSSVSYLTCFYGQFDCDTRRLKFARGGHPPAIVLHADGSTSALDSSGIFLGMYDDEVYSEDDIQLIAGDKLVLYTDGITETRNPVNEFYGYDRFHDLLITHRACSCDKLLSIVFDDLHSFSKTDSAHDDQTLVIFEVP